MSAIIIRQPARKGYKGDFIKLNGVIRVAEEAELAVMQLAARSGLSMKNVASQLIIQAAEQATVEPLEVSLPNG